MKERQHQMVLGRTHPTGTEEWYCPDCGRSLLITWKPRFMRVILEPGDEFAIHSGVKGGWEKSSTQVDVIVKEKSEMPLEDPWLEPWEEWLDKVDFEKLWND